MEAYSDFASVYDELMDSTPYEDWKRRIVADIRELGISQPNREATDPLESERNLVLDLACGTGTLTELLYREGYDMIGVDSSDAMLAKAMEKRDLSGSDILYLQQDMRELELYCTVGTVISVCDSLNYLLAEEELKDTFGLVHNYLYPGGLFLFDVNTVYKYRDVIGDTTIAENREDCSFIWENFYDGEEGINEYDVTIYVQEESGLYRRFEETHFQRGYDEATIRRLLEETGFELLKMIDSDTGAEATEETERLYAVARCKKEEN
jgi:SAM-dependent methyltransferase